VNKRYIVGAIVAAVVVVGVLVAVSLAGGDSKTTVSGITGVAENEKELAGIPQKGNVLGDPSAPVTIVEYGDIACPGCQAASEEIIPMLTDEYVRTGKAKLEFRPIAFISQTSERGALGVEAAALQDKMWTLVSLLYRNQGDERDDWLSDALLEEAAAKAGLDVDKWKTDYAGDAVAATYFERSNAASADGVDSTPTFIVKGPRGQQEANSLEGFASAIEAVGPPAS
jgi:protein-disulfide isomerase